MGAPIISGGFSWFRPMSSISPTKKRSAVRRKRISVMYVSSKALLALGVASVALPIFSSGGKRGLNFWYWVYNHTIFAPFPEYVPEEDYKAGFAKLSPSTRVMLRRLD